MPVGCRANVAVVHRVVELVVYEKLKGAVDPDQAENMVGLREISLGLGEGAGAVG